MRSAFITVMLVALMALWPGCLFAGSCGSADDGDGTTHCTGESPFYADSLSDDDAAHCSRACLGQDGDELVLPAGEATWSTVIADQSVVRIGAVEVKIRGGGVGQTIVTDATGIGYREVPFLFGLDGGGKPFEISGIEFRGNNNGKGAIQVLESVGSTWVIHDIKFYGQSSGNGIATYGISAGLIYNLEAETVGNVNWKTFQFSGYYISETERGETSWSRPLDLGNPRNVIYVEDSTLNADDGYAAFDVDTGARLVFRKNNVHNASCGTHGRDGAFVHRSGLYVGVYDNTFTGDNLANYTIGGIRGGTGFFLNNRFDPEYNASVIFYSYCSYEGDVAPGNCFAGYDKCEAADYPCLDQVGRAPDGDDPDTRQDHYPYVIAGNQYNAANDPWANVALSGVIEEDRDWYDESSGTTSGTTPPGTCIEGHFFLDTDAGSWDQGAGWVLFRCGAGNNWVEYFTPHTYPHPLRRQVPQPPAGEDTGGGSSGNGSGGGGSSGGGGCFLSLASQLSQQRPLLRP